MGREMHDAFLVKTHRSETRLTSQWPAPSTLVTRWRHIGGGAKSICQDCRTTPRRKKRRNDSQWLFVTKTNKSGDFAPVTLQYSTAVNRLARAFLTTRTQIGQSYAPWCFSHDQCARGSSLGHRSENELATNAHFFCNEHQQFLHLTAWIRNILVGYVR